MRRSRRSPNDTFLSIALFGLVFFGFYFVFSSLGTTDRDEGEFDFASLDRRVDIEVNKSLRGVYDRKQLRDLEVNTEKIKLSQKFSERFKEKSRDWIPEKESVTELYQEDMSNNEIRSSTLSVEAHLRSQITAQKDREAQDQHSKLEYIRRYKENAKRDGWLVELNDQLEVISAVPTKN